MAERPEPDWASIHAELKKKGVTKQLLWQEYLETHPGGYTSTAASASATDDGWRA